MLLLIDRIISKIVRTYRKNVFKRRINCKHNSFCLVDKVTLINTNIKLGKNVVIYPDVMFFGDGPIVIGDNVNIGNGTIIYASKDGGVTIGNDTQIAAQCYIIDMDHSFVSGELIRNQKNRVSPVVIGDDCWLSANVTVLKGSVIECGAVVGAKSLVKGTLDENSVNVGIPAKAIKFRNEVNK